MLNDIKKDASTRMQKSVDAFRQELTKLRTGRATSALARDLDAAFGINHPTLQIERGTGCEHDAHDRAPHF